MQISEHRLRRDIEANAEFGSVVVESGHGRSVLTGTEADRKAREYFCERLRDAGLAIRVDRVGNIVGRWTPESADPTAKPVAAGSHLDSVPDGGIFDGPLGIYAALESVRAMQDAGVTPTRPIEVVCFTEEEGQRFDGGLLGSAVAAGEMTPETALALEDDSGVTLKSALDEIGFHGEGQLVADEWHAWLELHIEQSERLEEANVPAGIVTTITGLSRCAIEITGEANHAGSTPMRDRSDALTAGSEFVLDLENTARECADSVSATAVATVGKLRVRPNAPNVIPGHIELSLDVRDIEVGSIERIIDGAKESLERIETECDIVTEFERPWNRRPIPMSDRCRNALRAAGEAADINTQELHSGAAHDTMHVAKVTDAGLLFAPSRNGISHNPLEWTDWDDCAASTQVLGGALKRLACE
ncbi:Zn-dependent hydrolase [Haladaptatus caseinilyticus]|uniref:Zn-dependent hydrolase n=1 Tax=Haladaptatus caseinilyticus TaxID=2993314 RepID=UPI00224A7731|nr:Zn-dependent hydrolase [Haladaptatus caseinilyticus]